MSFIQRQIETTITIGVGPFGDTSGEKIVIRGLRQSVHIVSYGADSMGQVNARIFGLPLQTMNRLTTIGPIATQIRNKNRIVIKAGDAGQTLTTIFDGTIDAAWGEFEGAPEVAFNVTGYAGLDIAVKPASAASYPGSVDAATVLQGFATAAGLTFENSGAMAQLANPYYPGTLLEQIRACARAADFNYLIDRGTLAIWPRKGFRKGDVPVISPTTGLVGYPAFTASGISVRVEFLPGIRQGGKINLQSQLTPANGQWNVFNVQHDLECEMPNGQWFTRIQCGRFE